MAETRFERTLFLDADTRVMAPLGDLFDVLKRFDCAMAHDVRRASDLVQEGLAVRAKASGMFVAAPVLEGRIKIVGE